MRTKMKMSPWMLLATILAVSKMLSARQDAVPMARKVIVPKIEFQDARLDNGLRVIIAPDHSAPVLAICVTYNVGSRNERPGRTGFAHLFEHMMFQGSQNIGKGEHFILVLNTGGNM